MACTKVWETEKDLRDQSPAYVGMRKVGVHLYAKPGGTAGKSYTCPSRICMGQVFYM